MGLGAPKKRTKLSQDPNNTSWSTNSANFGHQQLLKQGWQPGRTLGRADAAHAAHLTQASNSHIRVVLREDNAGLGADKKRERAETFGLNLFSGVLGRLNGKSEDVLVKEEAGREELGLRLWWEGGARAVRFVRGGLLVGDREAEGAERLRQVAAKADVPADDRERRSKKRKADEWREAREGEEENKAAKSSKKRKHVGADSEVVSAETTDVDEKTRRRKEEKKASKRAAASVEASRATSPAPASKPKKRKTKSEAGLDGATTEASAPSSPPTISDKDAKAARKRERTEKRARKEERRVRKAEKAAKRTESAPDSALATTAATTAADDESSESESETPAPTPAPAPQFRGRNAVRQRYIQQKRMAGLDAQSMREIFMVKT